MRVVAIELPHVHAQVAQQLARLEEALVHTQPHDLVVLPELALTGYVSPTGDFDRTALAEPIDGPTARHIEALALAHNITLCAPLVEKAGDNLFNTLIVRGQATAHYRKRHPWYPETWATPGDLGHPVVSLGGVRITFAICFDVHFIADEAPLADVDCLVFPSAWVEDEPEQRESHLSTLAHRFGISVVNANWGKGTPRVATQGRSLILDRSGIRAETKRGTAGVQIICSPIGPASTT